MDIDILRANPDIVRLNPELLNPEQCAKNAQCSSKYGNVRSEYKGRVYDSSKEAAYAMILDTQQKAGEILAWFPQVRFEVAPGIVYVADFVVIQPDWTVRVEDVKSKETRKIGTYRMKRKLFKERYGRDIVEV